MLTFILYKIINYPDYKDYFNYKDYFRSAGAVNFRLMFIFKILFLANDEHTNQKQDPNGNYLLCLISLFLKFELKKGIACP